MKRIYEGIVLLNLILIVLIITPAKTEAIKIGEKAPNFVLSDIREQKVDFSHYKNKVIILNFWDTWCPPCKAEIPDFIELQKKWGKKGLQIMGIAFARQGIKTVKSFVKKHKINYLILIADTEVMKKYGPLRGIPTTFVISKKGEIYKKYIGLRNKEIFEKDIRDLLNE